MSLVNLSFPVTSDRANLPRLNWLTFRPKPMIYLRWLGSNPGGFIEIKRELTLWRAKQQPKFGLSERNRGGLQRWGSSGREGQSRTGDAVPPEGGCRSAVPHSPASQGLCQIPAASQCDWCWEPSRGVNAEVAAVQVLAALCEAAKLCSRIELCA